MFCKKCRYNPDFVTGCGPPSGAGAAAPAAGPDPVMEFYLKYVKRNNKGEMVVKGLPEEWKMLFKDAGVKPKELKDPKTASWLIGLMNDILAGNVGGGEEVLRAEAQFPFDAVQEGDLNFQKGDIITVLQKYDNGWADGELNGRTGQFPYNYVKELPPEPARKPPPAAPRPPAPPSDGPPSDSAPPAPEPVPEAAPVAAAAPPPPPMPAANAPKPPPPPPAGAKKPAAPPPPANKPAAADAGGRGFSANDLASGATKLRKVENTPPPAGGKKELKDLTETERTNMLDIISAAMNARRKDIDEDGDGDDDDDGWDDDDW